MKQADRKFTDCTFNRAVDISATDHGARIIPAGSGVEAAFDDANCWLASAIATIELTISHLEGRDLRRECEALYGALRYVEMAKAVYADGASAIGSFIDGPIIGEGNRKDAEVH